MKIMKSAGIRGKRNQDRIDSKEINDEFVVNFPLSPFQKRALSIIYDMRAVTTSQLVRITGNNYDYAVEKMLQLHLNGFVLRKFPRREIGQGGSNEAYYLLDRAGAIFIAGSQGIGLKDVKWELRDNLIDFEKLTHTLQISEIRAILEQEAKKNNHIIENCLSDRHLYISFTYEDKNYYLRPDMFLVYNDKFNLHIYLCEIDMGTMAIKGFSRKTSSFIDKIPTYEALRLSGEYKKYFEVYPRILVFTTTKNRALQMADAVNERQQTKAEFLFTTFDFFKDNSLGRVFKKANGEVTSMFD